MAYKILENNAIDNTNIEGAVFNKFVAGRKSGIIEFANNCSLSSTGNSIIVSTGIILLSGVRVRLTAPESFTVTSAPVTDTRYQVIAQLINTDGDNFTFSIFLQDVLPLVQNDIINDAGVYQLELGRFTHVTTGDIEDVARTSDILTAGGGGGADFEIGDVTTEMLAEGIPAEVDIEKRTEDDKTFLDFTFAIPKGDKGEKGDSTYDIVVKTQAEFEVLIASPTWLNANSVALVGDGGALKFTSELGIIVPDTVERVDGYNKARVYFSDYVYSSTYQQALTAPKTTFANIEFFINSSTSSGIGLLTKEGIRVSTAMKLANIYFPATYFVGGKYSHCVASDKWYDGTTSAPIGGTHFSDCVDLLECDGKTPSATGYDNCHGLTQCKTNATGVGYRECSKGIGCKAPLATTLTEDCTDWENDYNPLTNKPQINGVELSGNKSGAELGIKEGSNPNILINGDFAINQRGAASYTGVNTYTVDRWQHGTSFLTASVLSKGVRLTASTSGTTGANYYLYNQTIEDYAKYAGQTVTASLAYENNTFVNGKINLRCDTTSNYSTATMSTSGVITFTFTLPSSITSSLKLIITGNHTNGTAETIDLLYAKLELGSIATPFVPPLIADELLRCRRYYQKIISTGGAANTLGYGVLRTSTESRFNIPLSATLRTTPTIANNGLRVFNFVTGTEFTPNGTVTIGSINNNSAFVYIAHSASMGTAGAFMQTYGATANDFISFDAEIY